MGPDDLPDAAGPGSPQTVSVGIEILPEEKIEVVPGSDDPMESRLEAEALGDVVVLRQALSMARSGVIPVMVRTRSRRFVNAPSEILMSNSS